MAWLRRSSVGLLLFVLGLTTACIGYEWPPRPSTPRLAASGPALILPGRYELSGTVFDKPLSARVTIAGERWTMLVDGKSCSGKVSAVRRVESEIFTYQELDCAGVRYRITFTNGVLAHAFVVREVHANSVRERRCVVRTAYTCEEYVEEWVPRPVEDIRIPLKVNILPPDSTAVPRGTRTSL